MSAVDDLRRRALEHYLAAEEPGEVYRAREAMRAVRAIDDAEDAVAKATRVDKEAQRRESAAEEALTRAQKQGSCILCGHCEDPDYISDLERALEDAETWGAETGRRLAKAESDLDAAKVRAAAALAALGAHDAAAMHRALEAA